VSRRWYANGALPFQKPKLGDVIAHDYAAWRVISLDPWPVEKWSERHREQVEAYGESYAPVVAVLRPVEITSQDVRARDYDKHFIVGGSYTWQVYPNEHYPVCATCHGPLPCRERVNEREVDQAVRQMRRHETAGVCPACGEVVTRRQRSLTFSENLEVPLGQPVTFHLRGRCFYEAGEYEKRWVAADPEHRRCTLTCPGTVTNHSDNTYDCTQLDECPGPRARHDSATMCRCPGCWTRANGRWWGCYPGPNDIRNDIASSR
jgi:hypothetical protein